MVAVQVGGRVVLDHDSIAFPEERDSIAPTDLGVVDIGSAQLVSSSSSDDASLLAVVSGTP